jgi:hypothetical protein
MSAGSHNRESRRKRCKSSGARLGGRRTTPTYGALRREGLDRHVGEHAAAVGLRRKPDRSPPVPPRTSSRDWARGDCAASRKRMPSEQMDGRVCSEGIRFLEATWRIGIEGRTRWGRRVRSARSCWFHASRARSRRGIFTTREAPRRARSHRRGTLGVRAGEAPTRFVRSARESAACLETQALSPLGPPSRR